MTTDRPNIVLITTDYQSGEDGPSLGSPFLDMPALDRLCRDGVVFDRHYSTAPVCMPERCTWITGQYPHTHGKWGNGGAWLPEDRKTLMTALGENGYYTLGVGKMHFHPWDGMEGFSRRIIADRKANDRGDCMHPDEYAHYLAAHGLSRWDYLKKCRESEIPHVFDFPLDEEMHVDHYVGMRARQVIEAEELPSDQPWMMWVSFCGPHNPWDPPAEYSQPYKEMDLPEARGDLADLADLPVDLTGHRYNYTKELPDFIDEHPERLAEANTACRAGHYGNLTLIDRQVEQLLDSLEARGELDDTIVIWTADHGAMLGDQGNYHKALIQERSARVPFVVHCPSRFSPKRTDALCGGVDLMPTLLSLAGAPACEACEGTDFSGILTGEIESIGDATFIEIAGKVGVVTDNWKYFKHGNGEEELLHLASDPDERVNRARDPACADVLTELRARVRGLHPSLAGKLDKPVPAKATIRDEVTFAQGESFLPHQADGWTIAPGGKSIRVSMTVDTVADGTLFTLAERIGTWPAQPFMQGLTLRIEDGLARVDIRRWREDTTLISPVPVIDGAKLSACWQADGTVTLAVDGQSATMHIAGGYPQRPGRPEALAPFIYAGGEHTLGNPVEAYAGTIGKIQLVIKG